MTSGVMNVLGKSGVNLDQPLLGDEVLGDRGQHLRVGVLLAFEPAASCQQTGADEILDLHVSLHIRESAGEVKFDVVQSQEMFTLGLESKCVIDEVDDPVEMWTLS